MLRWTIEIVLLLLAACNIAGAHFVFVVPDPGAAGAKVVMSEDLNVDDDIDIEIIHGARLSCKNPPGDDVPLMLRKSGHAYVVEIPGEGTRIIHGIAELGVSQRGDSKPFLLIYHPKTIVGDAFDARTRLGDAAPVEIVPVGTPGDVRFEIVAGGKPRAGIEVHLILPDGSQKKVVTDKDGRTESFHALGRYGVWARYIERRAGESAGQKYDEVRHYPTLVADITAAAPTADAGANALPVASKFAVLPETTSSFGAAVSDGWLYVYGGHITPTHVYSRQAVSGKFHRLNLADGKTWEELPGGPGLQGLNIAAFDGKIYRAGGMEPRNESKEKPNNFSIADCVRFDPAKRAWEVLPPMPEPRSSHDVAIVDGKLFVVGGWTMKGHDGDTWLSTAAMLDLKSDKPVWQSIKQPFKRRAMVAVSFNGKLYAIGGFTDDDEPTLHVDIYDPQAKTWSSGPALPGPVGNGFAPAAGAVGKKLFVSVADGSIYRLDDAARTWIKIGTSTPRIVHRMALDGSRILLLGGAAKGDTLDLIEALPIDRD